MIFSIDAGPQLTYYINISNRNTKQNDSPDCRAEREEDKPSQADRHFIIIYISPFLAFKLGVNFKSQDKTSHTDRQTK